MARRVDFRARRRRSDVGGIVCAQLQSARPTNRAQFA